MFQISGTATVKHVVFSKIQIFGIDLAEHEQLIKILKSNKT